MTPQDKPTDNQPYFFGYGSLVNRKTHGYGNIQKAKLNGWRRVWRQTAIAPRPILTVEPCMGMVIEGLIAHVPGGDWAALDAREHHYDRVSVFGDVEHSLAAPIDIATYTIPTDKHPASTKVNPIYLSYLDVVIQGYLREFGETSAWDFFQTTVGWDAPIKDDRHDPIYPRHQTLTKGETNFVDTALLRFSDAGAKAP